MSLIINQTFAEQNLGKVAAYDTFQCKICPEKTF